MICMTSRPTETSPDPKRRRAIDPGYAAVASAVILAVGSVVGILIGRATVNDTSGPSPNPDVTVTVTMPAHGGNAGPSGGASVPSSPTHRPTADSGPTPVWTGAIRITDEGINLGGLHPSVSDGAFDTIILDPSTATFSTANSTPVGLWLKKREPTFNQCQDVVEAEPLSSQEAGAIRYQKNLGLCIHTFSTGNLAFVRILGPPTAQSADARAIIWPQQPAS
jgi:hypothetical protein